MNRPLPAGAWLGVLGGGQLGRMFVHAAQRIGFKVLVLDPDAASPAAAAADRHLAAAYTDAAALDALAAQCAAVTTEFENVPADSLALLQSAGTRVSPAPDAVRVCQHRAREKATFVAAQVPCAPFAEIASQAQLDALLAGPHAQALLPGILKTSTLGYDGKGQRTVADAAALRAAWPALGGVPCVLESRLPLRHELSVVVARGVDGRTVHLPVQQNLHRDGILAVTQVPAPDVGAALAGQAVEQAVQLAAQLGYVGVLCVEFFVVADAAAPGGARLVANEMAPRPHNSGHWSIDGSDVSQFDLQVLALAGWPLPTPRQHSPAVMLNLLGDLWPADGTAPAWPAVAALPGAKLHLYGKADPRPGRKMGHLTVTAADAASARAQAAKAAAVLGLPAF
jgi:5-(carboxyamino)imidazole ribonucleotide synthase